MKKLVAIGLFSLCGIAACSSETVTKPVDAPAGTGTEQPPADQPAAATATIGAAGGSVEADGVVLEVPAGALAEDTEIVITKTADEPPARHMAITALFKLEPAGLKFKKPAKLTFKKLPADAVDPVIGLAKTDGADGIYEGQVSKSADDTVAASISKLANAFVATTDCKDATQGAKAVCKAVPAPATLKSGNVSGFALTGFEYWQWFKPDPYKDGNEVAWGYNGDGEPKTGVKPTDQSRACMAESHKALEAILADPPQELVDLKTAKGVKQFWFWNNDMSDAKATVKVPKNDAELWLYAGDRGDGGLIKWISSTERDGVCHLPTKADLVTFAKACKTDFPECGSGK